MQRPIFKQYNQGLDCLFPIRLDEKIPAGSPARLASQIVDNLDISRIIDTCKGGGTASYHSRMMLKVLLYAYLNNIYSCRKIAKNIRENIHCMWSSGMQEPDFHTINTLRFLHLKDAINHIFRVCLKTHPLTVDKKSG
jgi:transposase